MSGPVSWDPADERWQRAMGAILDKYLEEADPQSYERAIAVYADHGVMAYVAAAGRGGIDNALVDRLCEAMGVGPATLFAAAKAEYDLEDTFRAPAWATTTEGWEETTGGSEQRLHITDFASAGGDGLPARGDWSVVAIEERVGSERFTFPPTLRLGVVGMYRDEATVEFASAEEARAFAREVELAAAGFERLTGDIAS